MQSCHRFFFKPAGLMEDLKSDSVDLVVTSPPYPMVQMWDELFSEHDPDIREALARNDGQSAFAFMHRSLAGIWAQMYRVLKEGGIACINIGDATRTLNGCFALYPNHARILNMMQEIGFSVLPAILWRKPTNAPNKFMGSGMMPPGAYVTLEHEYILIFRKKGKREFIDAAEKRLRRESSYFWEERNTWFSDVWTDLRGTPQELADGAARQRSAAFPFELPYRLVSMFSIKGDTVLDPFLGAGTTMLAAMAAGRHSVGYEIDPTLQTVLFSRLESLIHLANQRIHKRLADHGRFIKDRLAQGGTCRYMNRHYHFPVVTSQETDIFLNPLTSLHKRGDHTVEISYEKTPPPDLAEKTTAAPPAGTTVTETGHPPLKQSPALPPTQRPLFD